MTHQYIFSDNQYEISYEDGLPDKDGDKGFWLRQKNAQRTEDFEHEPYIKITPPFSITIDKNEISVVLDRGEPVLYWRRTLIPKQNEADDNLLVLNKQAETYEYRSYRSKNHTKSPPLGINIFDQNLRDKHFKWHNLKNQLLSLTLMRPKNKLFTNSSLSKLQKKYFKDMLFNSEVTSCLSDLITSCTSLEQYQGCIQYLLGYKKYPKHLLDETHEALKTFQKDYLTPQGLHVHKFNGGHYYTGYMATLGEARQYIKVLLHAELQRINSDDEGVLSEIPPEENEARKAPWNQLGWPGEDLTGRPNYTPIYERVESAEFHQQLTDDIKAIAAVHEYQFEAKNHPAVKSTASLPELEKASLVLQKFLTQKDLNDHVHVFVGRMSGHNKLKSSDWLKDNFLLPLYQAVQEKRSTLLHNNSQQEERDNSYVKPRSEQFKILRVDEWDGVKRDGTHADFVNKQFEIPQGIFLIPDNFDDAALPENQRHTRKGRGGLANPMAPIKITEDNNGTPLYDLCTVGIPTEGNFNGNVDEAKKEIKKYFATLYAQIKIGRTIVVPYEKNNNEIVPAFGTGTFADANFTDILRPFILEEFRKLQLFCAGGIEIDKLDYEYFSIWTDPNYPISPLALPHLTLPKEVVVPTPTSERGIEGQDFHNPGFRTHFKEWFETKQLGELVDHKDEKDGLRTLRGTLSTGAGIIIYPDRMVLDPAESLSDEVFKKSIKEMLELYKDAYKPANPPPTRPRGTYKQKIIISDLMKEAGIEIKKPDSPTISTRRTPPPMSPLPPPSVLRR